MTGQTLLYAVASMLLFCIGLHALLINAHLLRKVMALNVMSSGIFLLFVSMARRHPEQPDPVAHAMVLTGVVVGLSATAVAIALVRRIHRTTGQTTLPVKRKGES